MEDVFKSVKAFLYDRSVSPLFGAYVMAWSVWNYRVIAILLSDEDTLAIKFLEIDKSFSNTLLPYGFLDVGPLISGELLHGFLIPSVIAVIYIYTYPKMAKPVYEYSLKQQKKLKSIKQEQEDNELLDVEQSRNIKNLIGKEREEFEKILSRRDEEIQQKNKEIQRQDTELIKMKKDKDTAVDELTKMKQVSATKKKRDELHANKEKSVKVKTDEIGELPEEQVKILTMIGNVPAGKVKLDALIGSLGHPVSTRYHSGELVKGGYLDSINDRTPHAQYILTHAGNAYLLKHKLA